jgi:sulfite exporter TauE/SafE
MLTLAAAVVIASLLGSMHCVGMCGPLAIWATGGGNRLALPAYHVGRLTTYLSAGLVAGVLGSAIAIGGDLAGMQALAAKIAGGLLIVVGIIRLAQLTPAFRRSEEVPLKPSRVALWLHRAKPIIANQRPAARAYFGGLLTTWLPCGWLYLFVLVAAGTGGVVEALLVMFAFWLGTLPALTALVLGARSLVPRLRNAVPLIAGVLLILVGLYTATGRASADLSSMLPPQPLQEEKSVFSLLQASEQPLPCCVEAASEESK